MVLLAVIPDMDEISENADIFVLCRETGLIENDEVLDRPIEAGLLESEATVEFRLSALDQVPVELIDVPVFRRVLRGLISCWNGRGVGSRLVVRAMASSCDGFWLS